MSLQHSSATSLKRVDVIASLEAQAQLEALELPAQLRFADRTTVALETQQMDEARQADELAAYNESMHKLLKAEKPTGTPHLFVLDPVQVAHGEPQARSTLQALANAHFRRRDPVAVVLLPPTASEGIVAGVVQSTTDLLKAGVLQDENIVTLESIEELRTWLQSL